MFFPQTKADIVNIPNQQDSQEAFANLLDIIENEIKIMKKRNGFYFQLDFQGYLVYQLHCFNCQLTELLFQDNITFMLDIERNQAKYPKLMKRGQNRPK